MKKYIYLFLMWFALVFLILLSIPTTQEVLEEETPTPEPTPSVIKYLELIDLMEENSGTIRVVIKTTDFEDIFHQEVVLSYDNQVLRLNQDYAEGTYHIKPETAGIIIESIDRAQGMPIYLGTMDIYKTEQGFVIVNELSLEEYLCSVVPSEMPSSYPMEALKAQAISARTYAAGFYDAPGYPEYNAHVDDSVMYQVYNNINPDLSVIQAVEETYGQILLNSDESLARTYYYSTGISEFEKEEPWYAWEYVVENLRPDVLQERLLSVVDEVEPFTEVYNLEIVSRGTNNVAEELLIQTDSGDYHVYSEYNIRLVLCNGEADALKQDGSTYYCKTIIPSGFINIDLVWEEDSVAGYKVTGNGFGHGRGMSQNGAKQLALQGYATEEILSYYYADCHIDMLYE